MKTKPSNVVQFQMEQSEMTSNDGSIEETGRLKNDAQIIYTITSQPSQ